MQMSCAMNVLAILYSDSSNWNYSTDLHQKNPHYFNLVEICGLNNIYIQLDENADN